MKARPAILLRLAWTLGIGVLAVATGCGEDYRPTTRPTTGLPAAPLDQVFDVEVSLPGLVIQGAMWGGAELEVRMEIEGSGYGQHAARVECGPARVDGREVEVQDLSDRRTVITVTPEAWATELIGPLVVEGTAFQLLLDGSADAAGLFVSGASYETQTATPGTFRGWRQRRFLVAGTDFLSTVGTVSEVALVKNREIRVRNRLEFVSSDAVLRVTGGAVFAVNRFTFDNLQRLDPQSEFRTTWQREVGLGSNPHDVLLTSASKGYVTRYEPPFDDVAVFDPLTGQRTATIPLGELADNRDATPRADRIVQAEGTLFVALQDIDRTFTRFAEGALAVIDPVLDEVVGRIPLGGTNPSEIEVVLGADGRTRLYVALGGILPGLQRRELSGGVVVVDVTNRAVERWALDDDHLDVQANIGGLAMATERLGYVIATSENFFNRVLAFDPADGTVLRSVWESFDFVPDLELDTGGLLAIPDRSFDQSRLCLYRTPVEPAGVETLVGCAPLQIPPFSIEALD